MAENNFDAKPAKARLKPGVLPGVRQIRRPDFSKRAEDIEKAEEARMQMLAAEAGAETADGAQESLADAEEAAAVAASLAAQEGASEENQLDESAITDEPKWYVAHTYSGYENKVKINIEKTIENRHLENQIFEVRVPMHDTTEVKDGKKKNVSRKMFPGYVLVRMIMSATVCQSSRVSGKIRSASYRKWITASSPPLSMWNSLGVRRLLRSDLQRSASTPD